MKGVITSPAINQNAELLKVSLVGLISCAIKPLIPAIRPFIYKYPTVAMPSNKPPKKA